MIRLYKHITNSTAHGAAKTFSMNLKSPLDVSTGHSCLARVRFRAPNSVLCSRVSAPSKSLKSIEDARSTRSEIAKLDKGTRTAACFLPQQEPLRSSSVESRSFSFLQTIVWLLLVFLVYLSQNLSQPLVRAGLLPQIAPDEQNCEAEGDR